MSDQDRRPEERYRLEHGPARRRPDFPTTPTGFKVWFVLCGFLGLAFFGLIAWAIISLVTHYT